MERLLMVGLCVAAVAAAGCKCGADSAGDKGVAVQKTERPTIPGRAGTSAGDSDDDKEGVLALNEPPAETLLNEVSIDSTTCKALAAHVHPAGVPGGGLFIGDDGGIATASIDNRPDPADPGFAIATTSIMRCNPDGAPGLVAAVGQAERTPRHRGDSLSSRRAAAYDNAGNLYYVGTRQASEQAGGRDTYAELRKLDPSGKELWVAKVTGPVPGTQQGMGVLLPKKPKDGVYLIGHSEQQLPGQPPDAARSSFLAKFDEDGKQEWLRQGPDLAQIRMDRSGNLISVGGACRTTIVSKLDEEGKTLWRREIAQQRYDSAIAVDDDDSIYVVSKHFQHGNLIIRKLDEDGDLEWTKAGALKHKAIIDTVEGVEWSGGLTKTRYGLLRVLAESRDDGFYVIMPYANRYKHGSVPRAAHEDVLIAAFDEDGDLDWARQYRIGPVESPQDRVNFRLRHVRALPDDDLVVVGQAFRAPSGYGNPQGDATRTVAFRVDDDGDPTR